MRCVGKRKQQERDEFVRNNRREVDRYAGLTDPVEIIREFHTWRKPDPLVVYRPTTKNAESLYAELTEQERDRLITVAAAEKRAGNKNLAEAVATSMATLTDHDLTALIAAWIEANEFYPAVLFRRANSAIRDHIVAFLESEDLDAHRTLPVDHALSALAWIGDEVVQRLFTGWEKSAPPWRKLIYVGPNAYAQTAGWELAGSAKRDLVYDSCIAISPKTTEHASDPAVSTFTPSEDKCPWCKRSLVTMLSVDTTDRRFKFIGWRGRTLPILTCDACTVFAENIFAAVEADDKPYWHPANSQPTSLPADAAGWPSSPWQGVTIELHSRGAMHAMGNTVGISASQIGGHPCWVQDSAYPKCPECGETLMFVAQLDNSDPARDLSRRSRHDPARP